MVRNVLQLINWTHCPHWQYVNLLWIALDKVVWQELKNSKALHSVVGNKPSAVPLKCLSVGMGWLCHMTQPYVIGKEDRAHSKQRCRFYMLAMEGKCLESLLCHTMQVENPVTPSEVVKDRYKDASGKVKGYICFETKLGSSKFVSS